MVIAAFIRDVKAEESVASYREKEKTGSGDKTEEEAGIQDLEGEGATNTFFGLEAGKVTTGEYNSFFGRDEKERAEI